MSVSGSWFVAIGRTPCEKDYVKEEKFMNCRPELRNQLQRVFPYGKSGQSKQIRTRFLLHARVAESVCILWMARVMPLICSNFHTVRSGARYVSLLYMVCTLLLNVLRKERYCICLKWSSIEVENRSTAAKKQLNNSTYLKYGKRFKVEPFNGISGVWHVVLGSYEINPLR